jgi:phosphoribosylaminoimidazole carboxylase (NCAIR synthetase)
MGNKPSYTLKTQYIPINFDPNIKPSVLFISPDPKNKFVKNINGIVKYIDPGYDGKDYIIIKLDEYFDVFAEDVAEKQDSVQVTVQFDYESVVNQSFPLYASDLVTVFPLEQSSSSRVPVE